MTATASTPVSAAAGELTTQFGTELIIDLGGCDPLVVRHADALACWATMLAERIGMQCHGDPIIQQFGEGSLYGCTVIQLITTSNITVHGVDADNSAFINIFSCRPFDTADAATWTIDFFKARAATTTVLHRRVPTT